MNCSIKCCSYEVLWNNRVRTSQGTSLYYQCRRKNSGNIYAHKYIHTYECIYTYKYTFQSKRQTCEEQGSDYSCVPHHQAVINQDQALQFWGRTYFSKAGCSHSENYCCEHPFSHLISARQRGAGSQDQQTPPALLAPHTSHLRFFLQLHCKPDPSCCGSSQLFSTWLL